MKKLLSIILGLFIVSASFAQTTPFVPTQIPFGNTDIRGFERSGSETNGFGTWDNVTSVEIPNGTTNGLDYEYRFLWGIHFENLTQGTYDFTAFDVQIQHAINLGQRFSFAIMPMCSACSNVGTSGLTYPTYMHTEFQTETLKDTTFSGLWVPLWNSPFYLTRLQALYTAVLNHINSTSFNGIPYSSVIYRIDIRGYGDFGEWHNFPYYNSAGYTGTGRVATSSTLKTIIDIGANTFTNYPSIINVGAFDGGSASITPADVTYYALTKRNNWGLLGWQRDNLGDPNTSAILENNTGSYNPGDSVHNFKYIIMQRYQFAPIGGEPNNAVGATGSPYSDLSAEISRYGMSFFRNYNYPGSPNGASNATVQTNIIAASKLCGYRITIDSGNMTTVLATNTNFIISTNWDNTGIAPIYTNYNVIYQLRTAGGSVVWTGTSAKVLKLFLPGATRTIDNFALGSVAAGSYNLYVIVKDPLNYKTPLALAITGRGGDGAYLLRSGIAVNTSSTPVANAGPNQNITLPTSSTVLDGSGSTGTITSYLWTQIVGPTATILSPNSASTSVTGMTTAATYVFQLSLNAGASTATVSVTVNSAAAPVANAGPDQLLNLPTSSTTLSGNLSTGNITSYLWTQISGPVNASIASPSSSTTSISNLIAGTYVFQLSLNGGVSTDQVNIIVSASSTLFTVFTSQTPSGSAGTDAPVELGMKFRSSTQGNVVGVKFYKQLSMSGTHIGELYSYPAGNRLAQVTFTGETASGWQTANFSSPVPIAANTTYVISYYNAAGVYWGEHNYFASAVVNAPLTGLADGTDGVNGVFNYGAAPIYPNQGFLKSNYWVDVIIDTVPVVANAGSDQSITLPLSTVTLMGDLSTGTISAYAWTQVSGPNTATITNATLVDATASGLIQGTYSFKLSVNAGSSTDLVTIIVNPPAALAPSLNARTTKVKNGP